MRAFLIAALALSTLLFLPSASAKDFGPGDIRVCNANRCVPLMRRDVVSQLGPFYYSGPALAHLRAPRLGAPYFQLRFRNNYVTGIVAGSRLDRFLSYGVHLERFDADQWYAVPPKLSAELRRLTTGLRPLPLTRGALAKSH